MRHVALAACLALAALQAPRAAEAPPGDPEPQPARRRFTLATYAAERFNDLLDIFELNVGVGRGAKFDVRYGLHFFGIGDVRSHRFGFFGRRAGTWRELDSELSLFPLSLLAWPVEQAAALCGARQLRQDAHFVLQAGTDGVQHLDRKELNGDPVFVLRDTVEGALHTRWGDCFAIGAEAQLGVGVRAVVRPLQLADFVVGWVGIELDPWLDSERER